MQVIIEKITEFTGQLGSVTGGITGIFAALVALALLSLLFSRIGK